MKLKVDKTLAASIALHVLVIGWSLVLFSTRAFEVEPEESVSVDVVSADAFAKAGLKTGKKENPKPLVDKVAVAEPVEDAVGKTTPEAAGRDPHLTAAAAEHRRKPVEKKPDPPKPVAEN